MRAIAINEWGGRDKLERGQGFERRFYNTVGLWQVIVYARSSAGPIG